MLAQALNNTARQNAKSYDLPHNCAHGCTSKVAAICCVDRQISRNSSTVTCDSAISACTQSDTNLRFGRAERGLLMLAQALNNTARKNAKSYDSPHNCAHGRTSKVAAICCVDRQISRKSSAVTCDSAISACTQSDTNLRFGRAERGLLMLAQALNNTARKNAKSYDSPHNCAHGRTSKVAAICCVDRQISRKSSAVTCDSAISACTQSDTNLRFGRAERGLLMLAQALNNTARKNAKSYDSPHNCAHGRTSKVAAICCVDRQISRKSSAVTCDSAISACTNVREGKTWAFRARARIGAPTMKNCRKLKLAA